MPTIEQLEKLLSAEPDDAFTLYALAHEHAKQGRHPEAIAFYDRCLESDPDYTYAYYHKARSQEAAGDTESACATLETGLKVARRIGDAKGTGEIAALLQGLR